MKESPARKVSHLVTIFVVGVTTPGTCKHVVIVDSPQPVLGHLAALQSLLEHLLAAPAQRQLNWKAMFRSNLKRPAALLMSFYSVAQLFSFESTCSFRLMLGWSQRTIRMLIMLTFIWTRILRII